MTELAGAVAEFRSIADDATAEIAALAEVRFDVVRDGLRHADVEIGGARVLRRLESGAAVALAEELNAALRPVLAREVERRTAEASRRLRTALEDAELFAEISRERIPVAALQTPAERRL